MATKIATVSNLEGKFFAKDKDGNVVELKNGDTIFEDMTVFGDKNNPASEKIQFAMNNGSDDVVLNGTQEQTFDSSLNDEPSEESGLSKESVEKALIKELYVQEDKTDTKDEDLGILDETAAGEEKAKQNEGGEGQFADRDAVQTDVTTKLRSAKFELDDKPQEVERKLIVEQKEDGEVVDTTPTTAPTVTITEDTNNDGSLVNSEISGATDIKIDLPDGAVAGDTLNVTIDGTTTKVTITDAMITAKVYTTSVATPVEGATLKVSATITDQNNNTSASSSDSVTRADETPTTAPTVTITEDTNNDGSLVNSEISGATDIKIDLPDGAVAGDTLNVTIDGTTTKVTITDAMITAKVYTTSVATPVEGATLKVSATITDQNNNTSASSSDSVTRADETPTTAPTVTITEDTNNDGSLVNSEISGATDIKIDLPDGAVAGDTLNVTIDGTTTKVTITDAMITAKVYTTSVATPVEGATLKVSATITDQNNNTSASSSDSVTRADETPTTAPTVTITEDTNNDGSLVNSEISGATDIKIDLPDGAVAGDTLNVTIDSTTTKVTITDAMITAKVYTTSVATPVEGATLKVSATITDQNNNTSASSSDSVTRADETPTTAPTVTITEDTNNDGSLVNSEISGATDIKIDLPDGAVAGDTLNVTIDGTTTKVTITDAMITAKVYTTSVATPVEGATLKVSATITDQNNNTSASSSDSVTRADETPTTAPTVTITEDTNNDGSLVNSEISGATDIKIDLPDGAVAGDTLNVTIDGTTTKVTITDAMITAKVYTTSVATPVEGATLKVSATITDQNNNTSASSSDSVTRADETPTTAPTVTITEDTNNDGSLVNSEISGATDIKIDLPDGAVAGDTLNVTIDSTTTKVTITDAMITAKVYTTSVATPVEGATLKVSATITDQNNNTSASSSDSVTRADQAEAPTLDITRDTTTTQLITIENVNTTNNGFEISTKKADGSDSTISINKNHDGFGVKGSSSDGHNSELGHEEILVVKFDTDVSSIDVSFSWKHSGEIAVITFYKDGKVVGTATYKKGSDGIDDPVTFKPDNGAKFDKAVFSAPNSGDDYLIHSISYEKVETASDPLIVEEEGSVAFSIVSALTDTDGSESLKVELKDIPVGFTISDGTNSFTSTDLTTSVDMTSWDKSNLTLKTTNVSDTTTYTLKVVSTSTESSSGDEATTTKTIQVTVTDNEQIALEMNTPTTFVEDATWAGDTVTTVKTVNDPDGSDYTYTIQDASGFYAIDATTGEVTLTTRGAAEVNVGRDLPTFSVAVSSTTGQTSTSTPASVDPLVIFVNDVTKTNLDMNITDNNTILRVNAANGVFANDSDEDDVLSISTFTIAGDATEYTAGQTVTIADQGTLTLNADGGYTFTPINNYYGNLQVVTYKTNTGSTDTLTINVAAMADAPTLDITSDITTTQLITIENVNTKNNGFEITSHNIYGPSIISTDVYRDGFGVEGSIFGEDNELRSGELLTVDFDTYQRSIDVCFSSKDSSETAKVIFLKDGAVVGTATHKGGGDGIDTPVTFRPENGEQFNQVVFEAPYGSDYLIHSISYKDETVSGPLIVYEEDSVAFSIVSALTDTDGSESLKVELKDIPVGFTISDGTNSFTSTDLTTSVDMTSWDKSNLTLKTTNVSDTTTYTLKVVSTSTESSNGDEATTTKTIQVTVTDNEPIALEMNTPTTFVEDATWAGDTVTTVKTVNDPDGSDYTYTIQDTNGIFGIFPSGFYTIDATTGEVTLTTAGAAEVNEGKYLPPFTVTVSSTTGQTSTSTPVSVVINEPIALEMNTPTKFVEDATYAGDTVTTVKTVNDPDGSDYTYTIQDTNGFFGLFSSGFYVIDATTGEVTLTTAGASEVNEGKDLPPFTVTVSSTSGQTAPSTPVNVDPSIILMGDNIKINSDINSTNEDTIFTLEKGDNLDFSDANIVSIINVEKIDMTDGTHTISNLSLDDIMDMTGPENRLEIIGDSDDKIEGLDTAGWDETGDTTDNIHEYSRTNGDGSTDSITLTIDEQIDTTGM
ncbi:hypothetical protein [Sulfurimonas sp.]|uniref:hypothetical protein n=1 Tax=Sulfurimonas sp. TaxID=2022749 RepID=UPI002B47B3EC|nr:hypothetical protein [Sulfurimonas sp.]